MDKIQLKKNKIDLEARYIMQERNAILLALPALPLTSFNLGLFVGQLDPLVSAFIALVVFEYLYFIKLHFDRKLKDKIKEIDDLMRIT
ncbi:MAG: hypothetical protein ABIJ92_04415 [Candidatus Aenigmatarchaeota archaeon]